MPGLPAVEPACQVDAFGLPRGRRADDRFNLVFLDPPYAMHDLCGVMNALKPLLAEDAIILVEHEAKTFPSTPDGFDLYDSRKYGIAGVSFFRLIHTEEL